MAFVAPTDRRLQFYVYFLEMSVPLLVGLITAYLLAPTSDPAIELLLTCPCPLALMRAARLIVLVIETGTVTLIFNLVFILLADQLSTRAFWRLFLTWLPPAVCLSGLGVIGALWGRRGELGALLVFVVWGSNLFLIPAIRNSPLLQPISLFLTSALWPVENNWPTNRLVLLGIGSTLAIFALISTHDDERALGIPILGHGVGNATVASSRGEDFDD